VLARIDGIADPTEVGDPAYAEGLRTAVSAALDYGLAGVEQGEERAPSLPRVLLTQARLAARSGISLDTIVRRYFAGYSLLCDFLIEEAGGDADDALDGVELKRLLRSQAVLFDRLIVAVSDEYAREHEERRRSSERIRAERVRRLLDGELLDPTALSYDFDALHLGAVATGPGAPQALRRLADQLGRRLLLIRPDRRTVWGWLGGRQALDPSEVVALAAQWPAEIVVALGEPAEGLAGWRLTHRQAIAALSVTRRSRSRVARYADVALLAGVLQDDLLASSLRQLYLAPLEAERDGGQVARETLRAYFSADRNVSSAAAALGISRRTATSRLRAIEELLGRKLDDIAPELSVALRLEQLVPESAVPRAD
jgi:DNA-binding PucR family transcriptional regulator